MNRFALIAFALLASTAAHADMLGTMTQARQVSGEDCNRVSASGTVCMTKDKSVANALIGGGTSMAGADQKTSDKIAAQACAGLKIEGYNVASAAFYNAAGESVLRCMLIKG